MLWRIFSLLVVSWTLVALEAVDAFDGKDKTFEKILECVQILMFFWHTF